MNSLFDTDKNLQTTKNWTGFLKIYNEYFKNFKNEEINILEIGVDKGKSLELWRSYFTKAKICGIDIGKMNFKIEGVELITADQTDTQALKTICEKYKSFDIIIDDGSHVSKHIIASFKFLFDYLSEGGLYAVEDLQTSYFPRFGGSRINLNKNNTALNFLKSLTDSINFEHNDKPFYKKKNLMDWLNIFIFTKILQF